MIMFEVKSFNLWFALFACFPRDKFDLLPECILTF